MKTHGKIYQMVEQEINELKSTIRHLPNPQRQEAIESVRFADYLKAKIQQLEPVGDTIGNGWIPVSERLPAERERVLTVDKVGCYRRLHLWGDKWFDENGNAYVGMIKWMPLPPNE